MLAYPRTRAGRDNLDILFLQVKEAEASVLERFMGKSALRNHGQRVVEGQRLMQAASDLLLGEQRIVAPDEKTRDFYMRQLWDWKVSAVVETMAPKRFASLRACAGGHSHKPTPVRVMRLPSARFSDLD